MTVFRQYPYTDLHDLNLDWLLNEVKDLKNTVDSLDIDTLNQRINTLMTTVEEHSNELSALNIDVNNLESQLANLESTVSTNTSDISDIKATLENIDVILTPIETEIQSLSSQVTALDSGVNAMEGRVSALEQATFEAPIVSNTNLITCNDIQHLENFDYKIVRLSSSFANDSIQIVGGYIRFFSNTDYNPCALVIHNFLPYLPGTYASSNILSFGDKYRLTGSYSGQNGTDYCVNVPFTSLTGTNPYIANDHYTSARGTLRVLQLKMSNDGKSYDLWIYSNYDNQYRVSNTVDLYAIGSVFKDFSGSSMADIKAYWANVYGHGGAQVGALIAKHTPEILSEARTQARTDDNNLHSLIQTEIFNASVGCDERSDMILQEYVEQSSVAYNDESYCSFNAISGLDSNITVDYSDCKYGLSRFTGDTSQLTNWSEELRLMINIELTITGASAINTANSIAVLNVSNTLGASISKMIPLTAYCALPAKNPHVEAYLHTNGNVIFRCWFDDTNYDYTNNPITIRIAGYIPISFTQYDSNT